MIPSYMQARSFKAYLLACYLHSCMPCCQMKGASQIWLSILSAELRLTDCQHKAKQPPPLTLAQVTHANSLGNMIA